MSSPSRYAEAPWSVYVIVGMMAFELTDEGRIVIHLFGNEAARRSVSRQFKGRPVALRGVR